MARPRRTNWCLLTGYDPSGGVGAVWLVGCSASYAQRLARAAFADLPAGRRVQVTPATVPFNAATLGANAGRLTVIPPDRARDWFRAMEARHGRERSAPAG